MGQNKPYCVRCEHDGVDCREGTRAESSCDDFKQRDCGNCSIRAQLETLTRERDEARDYEGKLRETIDRIATLFPVPPDQWDILPECVKTMINERLQFATECDEARAEAARLNGVAYETQCSFEYMADCYSEALSRLPESDREAVIKWAHEHASD